MTREKIKKIAPVDISTHTLTWSVTLATNFWECDFNISTHTLTWSVTGNLI